MPDPQSQPHEYEAWMQRKAARERERIRAITRAIAEAGFPEARRSDVLAKIVGASTVGTSRSLQPPSIFEVHNAQTSAGDSLGSLAELRAKLEKVAQTAEKLRALIDELPDGARYHLGFPPKRYKLAERDGGLVKVKDANPLKVLIERAHSYHDSVKRGSGRPKNSNLHGLLEELAALWEYELPNAAGISKDGRGPVLYKGPLFDFVRSLLDAEEIPYHPGDALGRQLWDLWRERRLADERHAAGLCARCEEALQDKAGWLCDKCRGSWPWLRATVQKPS